MTLGLFDITCRACNASLPLARFSPGKVFFRTKRGMCKSCSSAAARAWNIAHPERAATSSARHKAKPEAKSKAKAWRISHKDYLRAKIYQWRRDNPDALKEITRRSRKKNLAKILIRNRQREIAELGAIPPWVDRKALQAIYERAQKMTKETGITHHVDHIVPLRGKVASGLHVPWNLQIITASENVRKYNKFQTVEL